MCKSNDILNSYQSKIENLPKSYSGQYGKDEWKELRKQIYLAFDRGDITAVESSRLLVSLYEVGKQFV